MFSVHDRVIDAFDLETPISVAHGQASYYGAEHGFHGNCMSNGQVYDKDGMTAAHRFLPFGTKVRVRHGLESVILYITDRGPFKKGRMIDLSEGAARKLGLIKKGVGRVTLEVLDIPEAPETYHHENPKCLKEKKGTEELYGKAMYARVQ